MSYHATISFKTIKEGELYSFFQQLKQHLANEIINIAEHEYLYMPTIRIRHKYNNIDEYVKEEADLAWARNSIFTYRYFYLPEVNLLGVFGLPNVAHKLFDATCYFQNSCDQDYDYDEWKGVPTFEKIVEKWKNATEEEVRKQYEEHCKWDEECDYEYWRRSFVYDEIWGMCEKYLWDESEVVYLSIFGSYENYVLRAFVHRCRKCYEEKFGEEKKDE